MNLQEQLAIQAMYDAGIEREKKAKRDKPKSTLGPFHPLDHDGDGRPGGSLPDSVAPRRRGRKPKAAG